jgi:MSHA biogenesis protein MshQ
VSSSFKSHEAHVDLIGNNLRFGRIKMSNVHGSEIKALKIPIAIEYFDANSSFIINTDDTECTQVVIDDLNITLIPAASTSIVSITKTGTNEQVVNITAPNNGNHDVIRISPNLDKWLRYDWSKSGDFNEDPSATATFGIFNGHRYLIYMEQSHQ